LKQSTREEEKLPCFYPSAQEKGSTVHSRIGPMERMGRIQPCKTNERAWTKPPYQPAQPEMPEILSIMH